MYIVFRVDGIVNAKNFTSRLTKLSNQIRKQLPKRNNQVMVANDPEIKNKKNRLKNGIPVTKEMEIQFKRLSKKFDINLSGL